MHLIQLMHPTQGRRIGVVKEPDIVLLDQQYTSAYQLFSDIVNKQFGTFATIEALMTPEKLAYDPIYASHVDWRVLPPADCPEEPMRCMLSGTGLTHKASADNRNKMHQTQETNALTDSMKIYLLGEEGGKPVANEIGIQPEWFYKGNGYNLKGHGQPLVAPSYADDGGEEPEIAAVYLNSQEGVPYRLGFAQGNEFSDHMMETQNYLYLAPSKLRNSALGPELILDLTFQSIPGKVRILRDGKEHWSKEIRSGEDAMCHSLANLEYHHFKYQQHRIPGQLHIHFLGAGAFSFGEKIQLEQDDQMIVSFAEMGRPLVNPLQIDSSQPQMPVINSLS
ncbi:MAG: GguC family protein [Saprospiraceae bacterium]|nr:GguC family protein [Saprospiraceae bacterium]